MIYPDGKRQEGEFKNGTFVGQWIEFGIRIVESFDCGFVISDFWSEEAWCEDGGWLSWIVDWLISELESPSKPSQLNQLNKPRHLTIQNLSYEIYEATAKHITLGPTNIIKLL